MWLFCSKNSSRSPKSQQVLSWKFGHKEDARTAINVRREFVSLGTLITSEAALGYEEVILMKDVKKGLLGI